MKYIPDVEEGSFIFLDVVEMEYIMRLYLGLDSMTAMSDEIPKVDIYYVLHYDLIKLHKIILIFLQWGAPLLSGLSPWNCIRSIMLLKMGLHWAIQFRIMAVCSSWEIKKGFILLPLLFFSKNHNQNKLQLWPQWDHQSPGLQFILNYSNLVWAML